MIEALEHAGLTVFATDIDIGGVDDQGCLAQQGPCTQLQIAQTFGVLETLGIEDALDGFLLRVAVLTNVLLRALVHRQVLHEARIGWQHDS